MEALSLPRSLESCSPINPFTTFSCNSPPICLSFSKTHFSHQDKHSLSYIAKPFFFCSSFIKNGGRLHYFSSRCSIYSDAEKYESSEQQANVERNKEHEEYGEISDIIRRHSQISWQDASEREEAIAREHHNRIQSSFFDYNFDFFEKPVPPDVEEKMQSIVRASGLQADWKVLDCGAGTGAFISHFHRKGAQDITAVDLSLMMISKLKERFDNVRCWHGDVIDLPTEYGPFDVIFFNSMFGNVHSQIETLKTAVRLAKPGTRIVISHPLGAPFVVTLQKESPSVVPNTLPIRLELEKLMEGIPLEIVQFQDEPGLYLAILNVTSSHRPKAVALEQFDFEKPLQLDGPVVSGFGRGSRQMGVPTANLSPEQLQSKLEGLAKGVYYGWAQVPDLDVGVYNMVMNIGDRPTFVDGAGLSVEVHILNDFGTDFYGKRMRVLVLGFIRPEMKFDSLDALVKRIFEDIRIAREELGKSIDGLDNEDSFFSL